MDALAAVSVIVVLLPAYGAVCAVALWRVVEVCEHKDK